jgi:hypothetical protein
MQQVAERFVVVLVQHRAGGLGPGGLLLQANQPVGLEGVDGVAD